MSKKKIFKLRNIVSKKNYSQAIEQKAPMILSTEFFNAVSGNLSKANFSDIIEKIIKSFSSLASRTNDSKIRYILKNIIQILKKPDNNLALNLKNLSKKCIMISGPVGKNLSLFLKNFSEMLDGSIKIDETSVGNINISLKKLSRSIRTTKMQISSRSISG